MAALEYQLSYSAEDIDNRLGTVNENANALGQLSRTLETVETNVADVILNKVPKTRTVNGKTLESDVVLSANDVNADTKGSATNALTEAKEYTDSKLTTETTARVDGDTTTLNSAKSYTDEKIVDEIDNRITAITNALDSAKTYTNDEISKEISARDNAISNHNLSTTAHNDIRDLVSNLSTKVNTLLDSDDVTLDQMSEVVNYIKNNKNLIDGITTNKVNVSDIVNNLTSSDINKPLSANQGKTLKDLIDALQTTVNGKSDANHTHKYAASESVGGSATSAVKLDSSAGSVTKPVYFYNGKPTEISYSIQSNVPSNAKFTDTTYSTMKAATSTVNGEGGLVPTPIAGQQTAFLRGDGNWAVPTNTTYSNATTSNAGLMSAADKSKLDGLSSSASVAISGSQLIITA